MPHQLGSIVPRFANGGDLARHIEAPWQGSGPMAAGSRVSAAKLLAALGWQRRPGPWFCSIGATQSWGSCVTVSACGAHRDGRTITLCRASPEYPSPTCRSSQLLRRWPGVTPARPAIPTPGDAGALHPGITPQAAPQTRPGALGLPGVFQGFPRRPSHPDPPSPA